MSSKEVLFEIYGIMDDTICDTGIVYCSNNRYYLQWVGLGTTKRISKKLVDELAISDLRIRK